MSKPDSQNALVDSEPFKAALDAIPESVLMVDREAHILLANQAARELIAWPVEQLIGFSLDDLSASRLGQLGFQPEELQGIFDRLREGKLATIPNKSYLLPDRQPSCLLERAIYPARPEEKTLRWLFVYRDVTAEHTAHRERQASVDSLTHNLRSPVSAILGSLDLLEAVLPQEDRDVIVTRSLRVARRGAKRALRLIMSLLDITWMQSSQLTLSKKPVDLTAMITEVVNKARSIAKEYDITIRVWGLEGLPVILADAEKLERVIANLLDNAIKFSPEDSQVQVMVEASEQRFSLQVQDCGPRIPPEYHEKIFERYWKIPGQLGRWQGIGIGLAFCREVVAAHGGKIWVENRPKKQGCLFKMTLPVSSQKI